MSADPPEKQSRYQEDERLLRQYVHNGSSEAFDKLVCRHLPLVYSVCLREVRNAQMAEDAAQVVFLILVRKAASLRTGAILTSWLFQTSCFVCKDLLRQERRRRYREEAAVQERRCEEMQQEQTLWSGVEPLLNEVLLTLHPKERAAILLHFFDGLTLRQTGEALGLSEDAARMRVSRALGKMRRHLARVGVLLSVSVLAGMLARASAQPLPPGLLEEITLRQSAATPAEPDPLLKLSEGVLQTMKVHQLKTAALTAGVLVTFLAGVGRVYTSAAPHFGAVVSQVSQATAQQQAEQAFNRGRTRLAQAQSVSGRILQQSFGQSVPLQFKLKKPNLYSVIGMDAEFHYDGTTLWNYTVPLKQVMHETGVSIRTVPLLWGFDTFLAGEKGLYPVRRYLLEPFGNTQAAAAILDVPGEVEFKVYVDPKSGTPLGWTQKKGELLIQCRYVDLTFDAPMKPAEFVWTPPNDATTQGQPLRPANNLPIGSAAPGFKLQTQDGQEMSLATALQGRKGVLVNFWLRDDAYCQEELLRLESRYPELQKQGIALLSVNCGDSQEVIRSLATAGKLTFPIGRNGTGDNNVVKRYELKAYPTLYLIGSDGKIRGRYVSIQDRSLTAALNALAKP